MFGNNPLHTPIAKIAIKILPYQLKIEIAHIVIFFIGLLLKSESTASGEIIIISLGSLAGVYSILSFKEYSKENKWYHRFSTELIYKSFSTLIISSLFTIMHWPGMDFMLTGGTIILIIGNVVKYIIEYRKDKSYNYITPDFVRSLIIFLACGLFLYLN